MQSLGRVGRILSGGLDSSSLNASNKDGPNALKECPSNEAISNSKTTSPVERRGDSPFLSDNSSQQQQQTILQVPDVVASTKLAFSKTTDSVSFITNCRGKNIKM
jgi:hypothetical protein